MTHPFRDHIDSLLAQGEYTQAAALVRIDGWQPYDIYEWMAEFTASVSDMFRSIGEVLLPVIQQTCKAFEDFQAALAGVDLLRLE